jgi:DNA-binding response OmpR family regulator
MVPVAKILVVDDEPNIREVVGLYLRRDGHAVVSAADGEEALEIYRRTRPDLVVLDLMLPKVSGLEVCRRIQAERRVPLIMLTARGEEEDRIVGLGLGADDYVVKPFSPREVVLRVEALLRRTERLAGSSLVNQVITLGPVRIDCAAHAARVDDRTLTLTTREFDLLAFLAAHPGQTYSKAELMRRVWGWEFGDTSTVTVHVRRLREKVERDPSDPRLVLTVGRAGYRMARDDELAGPS